MLRDCPCKGYALQHHDRTHFNYWTWERRWWRWLITGFPDCKSGLALANMTNIRRDRWYLLKSAWLGGGGKGLAKLWIQDPLCGMVVIYCAIIDICQNCCSHQHDNDKENNNKNCNKEKRKKETTTSRGRSGASWWHQTAQEQWSQQLASWSLSWSFL